MFFKAVTNALRFNPNHVEFWVAAAFFEFEVCRNPFKARKIFYKALVKN